MIVAGGGNWSWERHRIEMDRAKAGMMASELGSVLSSTYLNIFDWILRFWRHIERFWAKTTKFANPFKMILTSIFVLVSVLLMLASSQNTQVTVTAKYSKQILCVLFVPTDLKHHQFYANLQRMVHSEILVQAVTTICNPANFWLPPQTTPPHGYLV